MPVPLPLLLASALVGILHMSAPDHWATLVIIGNRAGWTRGRLVTLSLSAGVGHVALSFLLGFVVIFLGLVFSTIVSHYFTLVVGVGMVAGGLLVAVRALLSEGHHERPTEGQGSAVRRFSYFAVLGAALSPDLAILPVFLYAVAIGPDAIADTAIIFAGASLLTLLALVLGSSVGLARAFERIPSKYNDALSGLIIAAVGLYVLVFG